MASVAVLLFIAALAAGQVAIAWRRNQQPPELLWEPRSFAASYTSVIGPLAAFSVASAIFMAGVSVNRQTPAFETMIGMLLIAYIVFTGTAMMFASTPGQQPAKPADETFGRLQRFSIAIAMLGYGVGVSIAWLTLRPLLVAIELPQLASVFTWVLLLTTFAACSRWVLFLYRLFETGRLASQLMPVLGLIGASFYYLIAKKAFPVLWPASGAPLVLTMILFGIVLIGFATHSLLLTSHGNASSDQWLARNGHRMTVAFYSAATVGLYLLWFAVAFPSQ